MNWKLRLAASSIACGVVMAAVSIEPLATVNQSVPVACDSDCTLTLAPGSAGSIARVDASHFRYTAPASIKAEHTSGGCLATPNDSVFATRVDSLPVDARSDLWIKNGSGVLFTFETISGLNILDHTTPAEAQTFHYTTNYNSAAGYNWLIAPQPNHREHGSYATFMDPNKSNSDHHVISVNKDDCRWYETYQNDILRPGFTTASGWQYAGASYALSGQGTTDAAGLPLEALTLRPEEVLAGAVRHALRFTTNAGFQSAAHIWPATGNASGQPSIASYMPDGVRLRLKSSFTVDGVVSVSITNHGQYDNAKPRPAVSFTGCAIAPTASEEDVYNGVGQVHMLSNGSGCVNPQVVFTCAAPCRQWGVAATANANMYTPEALTIITALKQYGIMLADIGYNNAVTVGTDTGNSAAVGYALWQVACPDPTRDCAAGKQPAALSLSNFEAVDEAALMTSATSSRVNPAYATGQYAVVNGGGNPLALALQPAIVQTPHSFLGVKAELPVPVYDIPSAVYPRSLDQTVTWTVLACSAGLGKCGAILQGHLYEPPYVVSGFAHATLTGTATADPAATTNIYLTIAPGGPLAIRAGNGFSDTRGGPEDIWFLPWIVRNGDYNVSMTFARGACNAGKPANLANLITQGTIAKAGYDYAACSTDSPVATLPAHVTDQILSFGVFAATNPDGWDYQTSISSVSFLKANAN